MDEILLLPSRISICNRYREMQYNNLHNVYISPYIYSKYPAGAPPTCPKCRISPGIRLHCLWECGEIQLFWKAVSTEISTATGQQLLPDPLVCLLRSLPDSLRMHKDIVQSLRMLARKSLMTKWVGDDPPNIQIWKYLISDVITLARLRYSIVGEWICFWKNVSGFWTFLGIRCIVTTVF